MNKKPADHKINRLLICPYCDRKRSIDLSKYMGRKLRINCECGQTFTCQIKEEGVLLETEAAEAKTERSGSSLRKDLTFSFDESRKSLLTCPICGIKKEVRVPVTSQCDAKFSIKCKCGKTFQCRFSPADKGWNREKMDACFSFETSEYSGIEERVFFVGGEGTANIVCKNCGFIRLVKGDEIESLRRPFIFHCKCGQTFPCRIDGRKSYRKIVELNGDYVNRRNLKKGSMIVKDISLGGLGIMVADAKDFQQGDVLDVTFMLDDGKETEIQRIAVIRRIMGQEIGCELIKNQAYDKRLGFYLLN